MVVAGGGGASNRAEAPGPMSGTARRSALRNWLVGLSTVMCEPGVSGPATQYGAQSPPLAVAPRARKASRRWAALRDRIDSSPSKQTREARWTVARAVSR